MVNCCAFGCSNKALQKKPNLTFHRFPKDPERLFLWTQAVRRANWTPTKFSRICSEHFTEADFYRTPQRKFLNENAVPSVFKGFPKHLQKKLKFRKIASQDIPSATEKMTFRKPPVQDISSATEKIKPNKPSIQDVPSVNEKMKSSKSFVQDIPYATVVKINSNDSSVQAIPSATNKIKSSKPSVQDKPPATEKMKSSKLYKYLSLQDKPKFQCDKQIPDIYSPTQDLNQKTLREFHSSSGYSIPIIIEVSPVPDTNSSVQDLKHTTLPEFQSSGSSTNMVKEENVSENASSTKNFNDWKLKNMQEKHQIQKVKIKTLQQAVRRKENKIALLSSLLKESKKKHFIDEEEFDAVKKSSPLLGELLIRQLHRGEQSPNTEEYSAQLQQFSLNLHHYSSHAYNYVRKSFNACLPHPRTITKWYQKVDSSSSPAAEPLTSTAQAIVQPKSSILVDEISSLLQTSFDDEEDHSNASFKAADDDFSLSKDTVVFMDVNGEVIQHYRHRRQSI